MANQMIALNARGPQLPDIGSIAARYSNVMANVATAKEKQAAVERANKFRTLVSSPEFDPYNPESIKQAQALDPAGTERLIAGSDARRKADLERIGMLTKQARDQLALIDPNDKASYAALRDEIVKAVPGWGTRLPTPEQWNADTRVRTLMQADDVISKTIATPTASAQMDPEGNMYGVTVGGMGTPRAEKVIVAGGAPAAAAPSASPVTAAPTAPSKFDQAFSQGIPAGEDAINAAAQAIANGAGVSDPALKSLTPQEFDEANLRAGKLMLAKPISSDMGGGELPPMTMQNAPQLIQAALQTGSMDQRHVDQLRQLVGPQNAPGIDQWLQQNGVQVAPVGLPGMRSAVYRPQAQDFGAPVADDGMSFGGPQAPMGQQIVNEVGTQFRGRPMVPPSSNVPLSRVEGEAGAGESGKQNVRVTTEPLIASGTKTAEYQVDLKKNLPKAKGALKLATSQLDRDIADVDYVLRNPAREMVVGQIEGRLPSIVNVLRPGGQEAQNVQDRLDKIGASSVVKHLQQMRESSPQGSSLFGQVTEYEDRLVSALAGLKQTQDEKTFDRALREYRNVLVEMRQNLPEVFSDTYGSVGGAVSIAPPRPAPGRTPTRSDIEYLRRNRSNPNVVNGFRKAFGAAAFNQAMKGG